MASGPGVSVFDAFNKELHEIINNDANVTDTVAFYDTYAPNFKVGGASMRERVINSLSFSVELELQNAAGM